VKLLPEQSDKMNRDGTTGFVHDWHGSRQPWADFRLEMTSTGDVTSEGDVPK